jgi:hypothetical protein
VNNSPAEEKKTEREQRSDMKIFHSAFRNPNSAFRPSVPSAQSAVSSPPGFQSKIENRNSKMAKRLALISLVPLCLCGCQVLTYTSPTGERFTRSSLGANTSIHSLSVESTTNGVRKVHLNGYEQDQTQALGAVTDAAVRAAIQAAKP